MTANSKGAVVGGLLLTISLLAVSPALGQTITLPDRIVFRAVALNKINTKNAKPGDLVKMQTIASETLDDGTVIETGTPLEGHVASSTRYSPNTHEASLSIVIDRMNFKGSWIPMHGFIVAQGEILTKEEGWVRTGRYGEVREPMSILKSSPVLRHVRLVEIGNPTHDSYLVSHKKDIVITPKMALLIRHAATH